MLLSQVCVGFSKVLVLLGGNLVKAVEKLSAWVRGMASECFLSKGKARLFCFRHRFKKMQPLLLANINGISL